MENIAMFLFVLSVMTVFTLVTRYGYKKGIIDRAMLVLYIFVMSIMIICEWYLAHEIIKEFFIRFAHIIAYMNI